MVTAFSWPVKVLYHSLCIQSSQSESTQSSKRILTRYSLLLSELLCSKTSHLCPSFDANLLWQQNSVASRVLGRCTHFVSCPTGWSLFCYLKFCDMVICLITQITAMYYCTQHRKDILVFRFCTLWDTHMFSNPFGSAILCWGKSEGPICVWTLNVQPRRKRPTMMIIAICSWQWGRCWHSKQISVALGLWQHWALI